MNELYKEKATAMKKYAHETCTCIVADDAKSKYCSAFCEDSKGVTTLECDCGHTGCEAHKL